MKNLALLFVFVQSLVFANNPVITLNGDSFVELYLNSYYNDPGATAFDSEDGDLSNSIVVTGTYDSSTMGSYVLAYSVTDSDGNESVKIRTIVVVDEINKSYQGTLEYQIYDSNQSGELDSGDDISFKLTSKNTGNVGGDGGQYDYTFLDFNANSISLTSNSFVGGIQLDVGDTNVSYSTYTITEQTLNSGGVELEVNLFFGGYYFKSNKLIVTFETGSSEEIILDGQISANNNQIKKVADPTDNLDAVNKRYVDQRTLEQTIPGQNIGDLLYWNGQSWQKLSAPQNTSILRFCQGQLTWGSCPPVIHLTNIEIEWYNSYENNKFHVEVGYIIDLNGSGFDSDYQNYGLYYSETSQVPGANDSSWIYSEDGDYWNWELNGNIEIELDINKTYFMRLFIYSNNEYYYSDVVTFTTPVLDDYDQDEDGYTVNEGDCNDREWQVNPGKAEICDGKDNDCNGSIDDLTVKYYVDNDFDGYGDENNFIEGSCFPTPGYVENSLDCNDSNDKISARHPEIHDDGIDNNCDGEIDLISGISSDQDGNTFEWIRYGTQDWATENAEVVTYRDGTPIPQVTDATEWANLKTGAWCYYNNDPTKGKLYNWYAVAGLHDNDPTTPNKIFSPDGWRIPNNSDFDVFENYLRVNNYGYDHGESNIGKSIASTTGWDIYDGRGSIGKNQEDNNFSGFNLPPIGLRKYDGYFSSRGYSSYLWLTSTDDYEYAHNYGLVSNADNFFKQSNLMEYGFSVRFIKE